MLAGKERYYLIPRLSWLIHRWNATDSQANIYVYGGVGISHYASHTQPAAEAAMEADYETRRYYISAKGTVFASQSLSPFSIAQLRLGIAPYVTEFEGLHTWFLVQAQYFSGASAERFRFTPLLRWFYRNVLWELGVSTQGVWSFNFMVHL